jgi:hypothetical protein
MGARILNDVNHTAGANTDVDAIFGEGKDICAKEWSINLVDAVVRVYLRPRQDGK